MRHHKVALLGLRSLENIALKELIHRRPGCLAQSFPDFSRMKHSGDGFDRYIVEAQTYLFNPEFFLPRKNRTVIVFSSHPVKVPELGSSLENALPPAIFPDMDEAEVESVVSRLLSTSDDDDPEAEELSAREKEVLREIANGLTSKEIADRLCISANTVVTHRKNISAKLGIKSASGLSLYALMNGLI